MAALPKKKLPRSRSRKRSSTKTFNLSKLVMCKNCNNPKSPHKVCSTCGYYMGRQVFEPAESVKLTKVQENK